MDSLLIAIALWCGEVSQIKGGFSLYSRDTEIVENCRARLIQCLGEKPVERTKLFCFKKIRGGGA